MPWSGDAPPYGFGPGTEQPWIPQPLDWAPLTVAAQTGADGSTLELYRAALAARRGLPAATSVSVHVDGDVLLVERGDVTIALNCGTSDAPLPAGDVLLASGPCGDALPADTAVWVRRR